MKGSQIMIIIDALKLAASEHIVYFLLTAYVETVEYRGGAARAVPEDATRMPVRDAGDVMRRLSLLRSRRAVTTAPRDAKMIDEVTSAFSAAADRLCTLPAVRSSRRLHDSREPICRTRASTVRRAPPAPA
ncbi:MAG TPA: hypothetical protein VHP37_14885 [Burkholderiales bacterium]|nr:hypothetical protein [Burkholderiales bacterium]